MEDERRYVSLGHDALAKIAGSDIWQWALTGGEDHVFVATTSAQIPDGAYAIGKVVAGNKVTVPGIAELPSSGFRHF